MTVRGIKRRLQKLKKKINRFFQNIEDILYRIRRYYNRKMIKFRDFTVISNNCWAGRLYQYLDMPYLSPTVGLYFFADDYLKFIGNLAYYLSLELTFIPAEQSKYFDVLKQRNEINIPIGLLDDVEIIFLHYHSEQEAKEKWDRRKARVNFDKLYVKFSKMNLCTEAHMKAFSEMPFQHKLLLSNRKKTVYPCEVYWNGRSNENEILLDSIPMPGNINIRKFLKQ